MASEKFHKYVNYALLMAIPLVIIGTILFGANDVFVFFGLEIETPDYANYYRIFWETLLNLENPYPTTQYPIGFLAFAGLYWIYDLLPKIFFCVTWIFTGYLINQLSKKHNASRKSTLYYVFALIVLNPVYLGSILVAGNYDVVLGLCILLAVITFHKAEQVKSGIYTALALLLKFLGGILIFPLVFLKRKINWKIGISFSVISVGVYLLGYIFWGNPVFQPFLDQVLAPDSALNDILLKIATVLGIDVILLIIGILFMGAFVFALILYFMNTDGITFSLISILGFIMVLTLSHVYVHYGTWFLPLAAYWCLTHNGKLQGTIALYHFGGLVAALIAWPGQPSAGDPVGDPLLLTIGYSIIICVTLIYSILLFRLRNKEEDKT